MANLKGLFNKNSSLNTLNEIGRMRILGEYILTQTKKVDDKYILARERM
jgi:hypothetical protein